jgi:uncharacterized membrane protein YfcA
LDYLFAGKVDASMLVSLLAGSLPAVAVGSLLSKKISGRWLQIALALVLLVAGVKVLV